MANNLFSKAEINALKDSIVGAEKAWEDIATVTIEESVSSIMVDKDDNGNPFSLSHIVLECIIPKEDTTAQRSVYFANSKTESQLNAFSRIIATSKTDYSIVLSTYAHILSGRILCTSSVSSNFTSSGLISSPVYSIRNGYCNIIAESFEAIRIFTYENAFPVGTKVILRGIRK